MADKEEKKTVTPLPQVGAQQEQQMQGQGPSAPTKEEMTPGQKVMSAAPWNPNYKGEKTPAAKPQGTVDTAPKTLYDVNQRMVEAMYKDKRPTPEQLEEERKRNKRNALLATIGDGLAAFHKAYSHARGVKPMELEKLSDKMYNRLEKVRKEREANDLAYKNAMLRAAGMDQQAQINFVRQQRELDRMAETKRHNEAMENYYADKAEKDREAKQAMSEAANQLKESIEEKRQAAQDKRAAESNATKQSVAATQAATRKEVASMRSGGKGGNNQDKTKTTTTYNRRGEAKKKVVEETKTGAANKKGSLLPGKK